MTSSGRRPADTAPPRVASWPHAYAPNLYLPLLYAALERHGVSHVPDVALDPARFAGPDRAADVLHLHWLYPLFRGARARPFATRRRVRAGIDTIRAVQAEGVPVVWTIHNLRPHDGFRHGERAGYAWAHRHVDLRVFHSRSALDQARRDFGPGGAPELIVPHGTYAGALPAPSPAAAVREREGVPPDARLLLCFGQIRAYKGFDVAVAAMRRFRGEPLHLVVAGRAVDRSVRSCLRAARGLDNVTISPETVSDQRTSDLFHTADAVLLPYRSITGSGVLLHAITEGTGVVASDLPYFREILAEEPGLGELVAPGDPEALAEGLRRYFDTDARVRGQAARRLAERYNWDHTVEPLAEWLRARGPRG